PRPGTPPALPGTFASFSYTLIPLVAGMTETPDIPFSYFDPDQGKYFDLTIPPLPVTVLPGTSTVDVPTLSAMNAESSREEKKLRLSDVTGEPGWSATSLTPLQRRGWFICVQLIPLVGFLALWKWDRHRRFLEQHPEIVVRRRARQSLQRERRKLQAAIRADDEPAYVAAAVRAMQVAVAPHHAAEPRALVSRDVLEILNGQGDGRETVQSFFTASDASQFSTSADKRNLFKEHSQLERVLTKLEAKL
ncbi:MAG: BatD family protein, partial [Akkermansiaceae bacterium]|nr:BatD family protein [Verrucomicrobiales bacterium]